MHVDKIPLISVIIPTHGRPKELKRALFSVDSQEYNNIEIIVVDDNGEGAIQKETEALVTKHESRFPLSYIAHIENKGYAAARNTGISSSKGEFVAFLDDDDEWLETKCNLQMVKFASDVGQEIGLVYCRSVNMRNNGDIYAEEPAGRGLVGDVYLQLLGKDIIGASSKVIFRRSALDSAGPLDEDLPTRADHDLFLRVAKRFLVGYVDEPLVKFYVDGQRITGNVDKKLNGWSRFLKKWEDELKKNKAAKRQIYYQQSFELGRLFYKKGNRKECFNWCKKAIILKPGQWKPYAFVIFSILGVKLNLA